MCGVFLKLLHSYFKTRPEGLEPDDFVRLCRAAGLMDGQSAFSNADLMSIVVGVIDTLRQEHPISPFDTHLDFNAYTVTLSELAAFRFSNAQTADVARRQLFKNYLVPLGYVTYCY